MITSRQKLILKAIVDLYSETAEPVGSKALMDLPYLNFSSATLRYDMASLEVMGYLEKTHTSSGRIPSEMGYKYYINNLITRDSKVLDTFPLIDKIFTEKSYSKELVIKEALSLLTDLTNYTAIAIGRDIENAYISKLDLIPITKYEAILLIVTNLGHVQHQQIQIKNDLSMTELKEVVKTLNDLLINKKLKDAALLLKEEFAVNELDKFMKYQAQIYDSFLQAFSRFASDSFYLSGMTNVLESAEYNNISHVKKLMDMLDRKDLVKLIGSSEGLRVRFSSELDIIPINQMTVISVPYRISETEHGTLALLGPNRMSYKKIIPLLEYIAANLAKLYQKEKEK
ncbi:MAG: heat-inducible transcriptional repressor HrcA [Acholeplasmataceae bacterium]